MLFRKTTLQDIDAIMFIIDSAKEYLKSQGIDQWQNGYPNIESITQDIKNEEAYVVENKGVVIATCMISNKEDPSYHSIDEGQWLQADRYTVIHRIAVHPDFKGKNITSVIIDTARNLHCTSSIRIDTHPQNTSMQRALTKNGFIYCGIIYVEDGSKRKAYEKLL